MILQRPSMKQINGHIKKFEQWYDYVDFKKVGLSCRILDAQEIDWISCLN